MNAKREAGLVDNSEQQDTEEEGNNQYVLAQIELINVVSAELQSGKVLDMNEKNECFNKFLGNEDQLNYKRMLKPIILQNIPDVAFTRPSQQNKPEKVSLSRIKEDAADQQFSLDKANVLLRASKILREELLRSDNNWKFEGDFENFELSNIFITFIRWLLVGPKLISEGQNEKDVSLLVSNMSQILYSGVKSKCQAEYKHQRKFYKTRETPFSVGLGLYIHNRTRSRELLDCLSSLNLSISYEKNPNNTNTLSKCSLQHHG